MRPTLNEQGAYDCGSRTFTILEEITTKVSLALTPGVLEQYGPGIQESETINAVCDSCQQVWPVSLIGEAKFKPLAA